MVVPYCAYRSQWHTGQKLISLHTSPRFSERFLKRSTHKSPHTGSSFFASRSWNAFILEGLFNSRLYKPFGSFTKSPTHTKNHALTELILGGRVAGGQVRESLSY